MGTPQGFINACHVIFHSLNKESKSFMSKIKQPLYQRIALQLAELIANGYYHQGQKLFVRSDIANKFEVSSETARKAVQVLVDLAIMEPHHGSGTVVASTEKAIQYYEKYQSSMTIDKMRSELITSIERQTREWDHFQDQLSQLLTYTRQVNQENPFIPYELEITQKAQHIGNTAGELKLWQTTGATIIAIQHERDLILSPGPYAKVTIGDILYFIGNEDAMHRMQQFFYPTKF